MKKFLILLFILTFFPSLSFSGDSFLSLKKNKVNVRYGPGFDYEVKYIYRKTNLPVKVIDKKENFRRIIDHKQNSGWIHISQLKKSNSIISLEDKILFKNPSNFSRPLAKIKKGKVLVLKKCNEKWCKVETDKFKGWVKTNNIWGSIK